MLREIWILSPFSYMSKMSCMCLQTLYKEKHMQGVNIMHSHWFNDLIGRMILIPFSLKCLIPDIQPRNDFVEPPKNLYDNNLSRVALSRGKACLLYKNHKCSFNCAGLLCIVKLKKKRIYLILLNK